jgi:hypothetical protein
MKKGAVGFKEISVARDAMPLPPWPPTWIPIGMEVPSFYPAIIGTARIRAILPLRIHLSWSAITGLDERWGGRRHLMDLLGCLLTGGAKRLVAESQKWFRVAEALLDLLG